MLAPLCDFEGAQYLFFGPNASPVILYSHLPILIISLLLALFVHRKNRTALSSQILAGMLAIFAIWVFCDSVFWGSNRSDLIMFVWSAIILIEPLVYITAGYLFNTLATGKDISFKSKLLFAALYIPLVLLGPTQYILASFDITTCLANETIFSYYTYIIEIFMVCAIAISAIRHYKMAENKARKEILFLSFGLLLFLLAFSWGNIVGSFSEDWVLGQYGLFGMPIFIGFLVYSIVKFKTLKIKVLSTEALVVALCTLIGAELFFVQSTSNLVLVGITLTLALFFGAFLIKSVRREVEQREKLEILTKQLKSANEQLKVLDEQKSQFLSFASHDLKSPLNIIKQFASLIADGTYKEPEKIQETIQKIKTTADRATGLVDDFLDIRKIEEGKMDYNFEIKDIVSFVKGCTEDYAPLAKGQKNIDITFETKVAKADVKMDTTRFRQVVQNLLSNSLKYTEKGWIKVLLTEEQKSVLITVKDSGIGMDKELLPVLFEQFRRDPGVAKKIQGTGLGLYISKQIVRAHGGEVWAESEGKGFGSTFYVRLPKI